MTVVTQRWWCNCKVNGRGVFLYDLGKAEPFAANVADRHADAAKRLFSMAIKDAQGSLPERVLLLAEKEKDAPGCSNLVARE